MLLALTVMWGSAFLFTKVAVSELAPDLVVAARLVIAALVLLPLAVLLARRPPRGGRLWVFFVLIALLGNVVPFSLITWGQGYIDSGLAGILMAVMPLMTLGLAHFFVPGERVNAYRILGFLLGFAGVVVLTGPQVRVDAGGEGSLAPILAVLAGAGCYAVAAILSRLRPPSDAVSTAAAVTLLAMLMTLPIAAPGAPAGLADLDGAVIGAVLFLGVFSTATAAIVYFRLIGSAGPAFVSQLNYLIPIWAVLIGVAFLGESPQPNHFYALALILAGVAATQLKSRPPAQA